MFFLLTKVLTVIYKILCKVRLYYAAGTIHNNPDYPLNNFSILSDRLGCVVGMRAFALGSDRTNSGPVCVILNYSLLVE